MCKVKPSRQQVPINCSEISKTVAHVVPRFACYTLLHRNFSHRWDSKLHNYRQTDNHEDSTFLSFAINFNNERRLSLRGRPYMEFILHAPDIVPNVETHAVETFFPGYRFE